MYQLIGREKSYWDENTQKTTFSPIEKDLNVDVVVVGGGITGLTCAYLLKQSGLRVAVLEKNTISSGTTGGTTGKVTSQHGIMYSKLQKQLGKASACLYAEANQLAIERIEQIIKKEKIDCGWQRQDNFVYTADPRKVEQFKEEARTAKKLGLPASFETKLDLPFPVEAAVKFANQAYFNARKYTVELAKIVHGQGSYVFEHSNAISFRDGSPATVSTKAATVTAKDIIVATKVPAFPLMARFSYAAVEYPHTSYIVAGKYGGKLKGMYISPDKGHYSILPVRGGSEQLLLIGGENHIPGLGLPDRRLRKLSNYAEKYFGVSRTAYRWKAMDYLAYDKMPLVGKVYPWSKHLYTATGFKKWGLTTSLIAATILHDKILDKPNAYSDLFEPHRVRAVLSIPRVVLNWFASAHNLTRFLAATFFVIGIAGFSSLFTTEMVDGMKLLFGLFMVDTVHNIIHLASGLVALLSARALKGRIFLQGFGVVYGSVTVIGLVQGHTVLGLFHVNLADNLLHVAIASACLLVGFGSKQD